MRRSLPLLLLLVASAPAGAQTCKKVPPPFLPGLFPESASGMAVEFSTDPTGGCTAMYRPASQEERETRPWAVVSIENNADPSLGDSGEVIRARFQAPSYALFTWGDWPVTMRAAPLGDEFVAFKGSVRVVVLVRNGDHGEGSQSLAQAILERILPKVPCGT